MTDTPLYRIDGRLYRAEPVTLNSCTGCAFLPFGRERQCEDFRDLAGCSGVLGNVVAKAVPTHVIAPSTVRVVERSPSVAPPAARPVWDSTGRYLSGWNGP